MLKILQLPNFITSLLVHTELVYCSLDNNITEDLSFLRFLSVVSYPNKGIYCRFDNKTFKKIIDTKIDLKHVVTLYPIKIKNLKTGLN